jgi:hypothetical protein
MRGGRCAWVLLCTALLVGTAASPAHAISAVYALQQNVAAGTGVLVQYTVGSGGTLTPSAPDTALAASPQDIAVTPDGRFAYVATATSIVPFTRVAANGRLAPGTPDSAAGGGSAILVNPQGTRVIHAQAGGIATRAINADGTLGAPGSFVIPGTLRPAVVRSLAMTADGRSLYASEVTAGSVRIYGFDVDPATGAVASKSPPTADWPGPVGGPTAGAGRMAITPSGSHLYLATGTPGLGIGRWAIDPATGLLTGGTVEATPSDGYAEAAVATSVAGDALWAPSADGTIAAPERIRQFSIGAGGVLAPLAPPAVNYIVAGPARDLVASPDGLTLYLGQDGTVGEWSVGAGGGLAHRANVPPSPVSGMANAGIALAPSQAPVAAFTAGPSAAGQVTSFDAGASSDPDGTIARFDWDFGDGTTAPNAGPTPGHVYTSPGTRAVTLTVTDADGTSTAALWTGTRMLRNGGASARAAQLVTTATVPPLQPPPPPRPHLGRSVTVVAERGTILVRVPGSRRYVPIGRLTEIPLGSIIDARKGRARITVEVDARTGRTQSSLFYDWFFRILQTKGAKPITEARLVKGSFAGCTPTRAKAASAADTTGVAGALRAQSAAKRKRSKRKVRQLWGHGNGSFRTGGKRSAATVRGTWWLVQDRCDATITRVKVGRVDVRDFRLKKTIRLRAKTRRSTYLAKAP